jgi:hypothetical protein
MLTQNLAKLVTILAKEPFQKQDWTLLEMLNLQANVRQLVHFGSH